MLLLLIIIITTTQCPTAWNSCPSRPHIPLQILFHSLFPFQLNSLGELSGLSLHSSPCSLLNPFQRGFHPKSPWKQWPVTPVRQAREEFLVLVSLSFSEGLSQLLFPLGCSSRWLPFSLTNCSFSVWVLLLFSSLNSDLPQGSVLYLYLLLSTIVYGVKHQRYLTIPRPVSLVLTFSCTLDLYTTFLDNSLVRSLEAHHSYHVQTKVLTTFLPLCPSLPSHSLPSQ